MFDDSTGDLIKSHLTIFLSRPAVPPTQDLQRSARSHTSPPNPTTAYLKLAQGSKPNVKKKKRDTKGKDKASEVAVPRKHVRNEDEGLQILDKPAAKKLKSKDRPIDEVEGMLICSFLFPPAKSSLSSLAYSRRSKVWSWTLETTARHLRRQWRGLR